MVAGDASAHMSTSMGNIIATEHSHLMMRVFAGGSTSACSKFACECDIACGRYHICINFFYPFMLYSYHMEGNFSV